MKDKWTAVEERFVEENCHILTDGEIALMLTQLTGKPFCKDGVESIRDKLGLNKRRGRGGHRLRRETS